MNQSNLAQSLTSLRNLLQQHTVGIVLGERTNLDTAAAALSLYLSLKEAGKKPQIISKKEPTVEISNLVGVDKIKNSFSGDSSRLVVSLPYNRGEIGKVSYKEENNRINFYLTAAENKSISPYETNDINLIWDGAMPEVLVVFGVTSAAQISDLAGSGNSVKIVNIDNAGESFGDIAIVDQSFSSVSEIAAKVIKDLRLPINIDIAQNLLDGILYSTKNFTKQNSSPYAFESAGVMMQIGAQRSDNRNSGRSFPQQQNQQQRPRERFQNQNQQQRPHQNKPRRDEFIRADDNQQVKNNTDISSNDMETQAPRENGVQEDIPNDWLMPKVFTGSQDIDDLK